MSFLLTLMLTIFIVSLYFIPTMIAISRRHANALPIFLLNLYLGATVLGWVGALIWAVSQTSLTVTAAGGAAATQVYNAAPQSKARKYTKIALAVLGGFVFLFVLAMLFTPAPSKNSAPVKAQAPAVTGTPVPADEAFGE